MLGVRLALGVVVQIALLGALLFVPAGTLGWPRAWALLAAHAAIGTIGIAALLPKHRAVLEERMRAPIHAGQPAADVLLSTALVLSVLASIAAAPLDLFRLHLLPETGHVAAAVGAALYALGWLVMTLAMRDNPFAATVVRVQAERGHAVAKTGVYAIVRHPMYAGAIAWLVGSALALGSYAGALAVCLPAPLLVARIRLEERFLRRALPGYEEYARTVRHRLLPLVW